MIAEVKGEMEAGAAEPEILGGGGAQICRVN